MAVCKRCGCAIPIGQKTCDICEPRIVAAQAPAAWQPAPTPVWQPPAPPPTQPSPEVNQTPAAQTWQVVQRAPQQPAYQPSQAPFPGPQAMMPATEFASSAQAWMGRAGGMQLTAETAPKAGFWMRVLAWLIDGLCYGIPAYAVGRVLLHGDMATYYGVNIIFEICYFMYFWSSYGQGQTIGMQLLHMKVVRTDGSLLSLSGSFIRFIGIIIAAIPFDIGLIWAAFDSNKQGWHDKLAHTYVVSNW